MRGPRDESKEKGTVRSFFREFLSQFFMNNKRLVFLRTHVEIWKPLGSNLEQQQSKWISLTIEKCVYTTSSIGLDYDKKSLREPVSRTVKGASWYWKLHEERNREY